MFQDFVHQTAIAIVAVLVVATAMDGVHAEGSAALLGAAVALGLASAWIRPWLTTLALPLALLAGGGVRFGFGAAWLAGVERYVPGFHIDGWLVLVQAAVALAVIQLVLGLLVRAPRLR